MTISQKRHTLPLVLVMSVAWSMGVSVLWAQEDSVKPQGVGLSVEPGGLLIQHVEPGQTYDLAKSSGISLKISNRDSNPRTYSLSTHRPSEIGNRRWLEGYLAIPDPSWFWFEQEELTIDPESDGHVKMYLKIPESEQYYNQHWTVSIGVTGSTRTGEMLALATYPRYQIETESNAKVDADPTVPLGIKPSLVRFEDVPLGRKQKGQIVLHNTSAASHWYTFSPITIAVDSNREQIVPSPGYAWIPELRWVSGGRQRLEVKAHQSHTVDIGVKVPNKREHRGKRWEALMWIEPDEGRPRFARIQIDTAAAAVSE